MAVTPFQRMLRGLRACFEGRKWVGTRSPNEFWVECNRGDWLLWLLSSLGADRDKIRAVLDYLAERCNSQDMIAALETLPEPERLAILADVAGMLHELITPEEFAELAERRMYSLDRRRKT